MHEILSKHTNIYIIVSVIVDIYNTYSGAPDIGCNTGFFSYVFELIVAFIDVKPAAYLVCRKKKYPLYPSLLKSPMPTPPPI